MAQETGLAGQVLAGKYRMVRRLGDGNRPVFEARHPRLAGRFAAKLWPATAPWDSFRRGAEIAAVLRHPGVVQVIDFNCEPGASPFLVMEWIDGVKLRDLLAGSGILPLPRVAALVESAAWALAFAHQQGVVHQELRPDDIFVVQAAGTTREWLKVAGFGVDAALARVGAAAPSPYRAPEQTDPDNDGEGADPQSDQYALAAIAYEMLSGVPPFDDNHPEGEPPPLSELAPAIPPAVDAVIRQGLAREPEERFAGVLEFARALRDAAQGGSTQVVRRRKLDPRSWARPSVAEAPVSPFFNPVQQTPTAEGIRPVTAAVAEGWRRATQTAAAGLVRLLPTGVTARIALALGALLLAFTGSAVVWRRLPRQKATAAVAGKTVSQRTPPARAVVSTPPPATPAPVVAPRVALLPPPQVKPPADTSPAAATRPVIKRPRAQARATDVDHPPTEGAAPTVAAKSAATPATKGGGSGACVMSVGSSPPADIWVDDKSLGRRTPLADYHLPCGDHKLVLKRDDLDIYQMEMVTVRAGIPFKKSYPLE